MVVQLRRHALAGVRAALETTLEEELLACRQPDQERLPLCALQRSGTYARRVLISCGFIPDLRIPFNFGEGTVMDKPLFGLWLKQRRKALDMTQENLAQQVGCAVTTIRKIEMNQRRPSKQIAERLGQHLNIRSDDLAAFARSARMGLAPEVYALSIEIDDADIAVSPIGKTGYSRPANLPIWPTPLIGRDQDILAIQNLLMRDEVRLLTLSGAPGIGKTHLGIFIAARLIDVFKDGVYFVELAAVRDPDWVTSAIAQVLDIHETAGLPLQERLKNYLRDKHVLLLLDNFEHVLSASLLVADLLAACPWLKVLVTSRAVLRLAGEYEFAVPPLALPDLQSLPPVTKLARYAAVALFVQRTQARKSDFMLTEANASAVAQICVYLEGVPLAIELAAVCSKLFTPQALLTRLSSRLTMLVNGACNVSARQQTLRDAIAWSYDLLDTHEQQLFRRLAVFVGGCTLEAVEAACNPDGEPAVVILSRIASLVDKSLLQQREGIDSEPRFTMLETIREYASELLVSSGEAATLQRQHGAYYLSLAEFAEPKLCGPAQGTWLKRLDVEHDNLRAVLAWSQTHAYDDLGLRLAGTLWWFWHRRGYANEGYNWIERALATVAGREPTLAQVKALQGAGELAQYQDDYAAARARLEQSLKIGQQLGDQRSCAYSLNYLAYLGLVTGKL